MSEDKSADPAGTPAAPVTQSFGEAPATIPQQSLGEAPATIPQQSLGEAPTAEAAPAPAPAPIAPAPPPPPADPTIVQAEGDPTIVQAEGEPARPETPAEPVQLIVPTPPKRRRGLLGGAIITLVVIVVAGALAFVVYQRLNGDPTKNATAGQCLANLPEVAPGQDQEASGGKIVSCDDESAVYQIESRLDNQDATQARSVDICKASPEATVIYRAVPDSGTGYVLCLKKLA